METKYKLRRNSAFSLIELLIVVATIAIVGAVAVAFISNSNTTLTASKLEQDVSRINTAVKVFVSNGGSIENIDTAQDLVTELKKTATNKRSVVGLRDSMVDLRMQAIDETNGEYRNRAVWKSDLGKFVIEPSKSGVREFVMNDALAQVDYATANRDTRLVYNDTDGWVWEIADYAYNSGVGPQSLPTLDAPTLGATGGSGAANNARLFTPTISPNPGTLLISSFPLQVTITKSASDPDDAVIQYSTEANTWLTYTGPFSVEPGTNVQAFTSHADPSWESSEAASAIYNNSPEKLQIALSIPKNPLSYAEAGGALEEGNYTPEPTLDPITVSIPSGADIPDQYENSDVFSVFWTYDGSNPLTSDDRFGGGVFANGYAGDAIDYNLPKWDGATVLPIKIVAKSNNATLVTNSDVQTATITIDVTDLPTPIASYNDTDTSRGDTVELLKMVDSGDMPVGARIYYTVDGTDPGDDGSGYPVAGTLYTGPFDPRVADDTALLKQIRARVYPPAEYAGWFNVSDELDFDYEVPAWEISGDSEGWFTNADGGNDLVSSFDGDLVEETTTNSYNGYYVPGSWKRNRWGSYYWSPGYSVSGYSETVTETVGGSVFNFGEAAGSSYQDNQLLFAGTSFENVAANERFEVGSLFYHNGSVWSGTAATAVDMSIELDFGGTPTEFDFNFDLVSTTNTGDAYADADYVRFGNGSSSAQNVTINDIEYSLQLEFDDNEISEYGFSAVDNQFHVQEEHDATAKIYAKLVEISMFN